MLRAPESSGAYVAMRAREAPELACCWNAASSGGSLAPKLACLLLQRSKLRSLLVVATQQAPKDLRLRSLLACCCNAASSEACLLLQRSKLRSFSGSGLLRCNSKLRSVRACWCNAANSEACLAPELAATKPCNAASSGTSLAVEEKEEP
jgi:hypothetical protein